MIASPKAKSHGLGGGGGALVSILRSAASAGVAGAMGGTMDNTTFFIFKPLLVSARPSLGAKLVICDFKSPLSSHDAPRTRTELTTSLEIPASKIHNQMPHF